jgi:carbon storage regulator CsrA
MRLNRSADNFKEANPMLVLTRKLGERIHIGSAITITVVEIRGNKVRLGIQAPEKVPVLRAELNPSLELLFAETSEAWAVGQ